ncbi:MAG: hypothetical protein H0U57_00650 [Tatlockia sp.]|nr:hypothetical protein [Tatlockia sp.]
MLKESDVETLIAKDKRELTPFILNLCGFTLDRAGYNSKNYAFYLHVAFRHQVILQSDEWGAICTEVEQAGIRGLPLSWKPEFEILRNRITTFAQSIVTEVVESAQDNWSIKLLKTSYFSTLDRARKSSENASRLLYVKKGQNLEELQISLLESKEEIIPNEETTQAFLNVLTAQRAYLDSLLALPFNLEKLCLKIARNNVGVNYQPRKTAEMLAKTLDTVSLALAMKGSVSARNKILIEGLKLALEITMPDFQFADHQLVDFISDELLPFIDQLIINNQNLEETKEALLPNNNLELSKARIKILASMDVHFHSVDDILQETLIKPVEQCNLAVAGAVNMGAAAYNLVRTENKIDRAVQLGPLFENFDKVASACSELDEALLPSWIFEANGYYQQLKTGASMVTAAAQVALNGLGAFYNCPGFYNQLAFYLPQSIRYYISQTDSLTKIFNQIDNQVYKVPSDKVLAYFAFYELVEQAKIADPNLKEKLFEVYMAEVVKADSKLIWEEFKFESYIQLEKQLKDKFNLKLSLAKRIEVYCTETDKLPTNSLILATKAQGISNPRILHLLVLINRLQSVESDFDIYKPQHTFDELVIASKMVIDSTNKELLALYQEFMLTAMQRLNNQFRKERLTPILEKRLESSDNSSHLIRRIYSKLKEEINLSGDELRFLKEYFMDIDMDLDFDFLEELNSFQNLGNMLPNSKKLQNSAWETPKEMRDRSAAKTLKNARRIINPLLDQLQNRLDEQWNRLRPVEDIELAKKKIAYIKAINGLINHIRIELNKPQSDLKNYLFQLLKGDIRELTEQQILNNLSLNALSSIPGKLMSFAWNVLPLNPENSLFYNLLEYSLRNVDSLHVVVVAEKNYTKCLNDNPIPALMNELNDPLAAINIIPSQEKIMDAILTNLIENGKQTAFSWGVNYLKEFVTTISYKQLLRFLPYPFLAELALMAINSEALQAHVAPVFNSMMNEYGDLVGDELKKIAKKRLYPLLGIELQKTVETCAYNYALTPENTNDINRDAFSMFYLQYCEIRQSSQAFTSESTIRFLFPKLLEDAETKEQEQVIATISQEFAKLDNLLSYFELPKRSAIDEANQLLAFLIQSLDLDQKANSKIIKLALINRLLIMMMDSADQLNNEDKIISLQALAINRFSDAMLLVKQCAARDSEVNKLFVANDSVLSLSKDEASPERMTGLISAAQKRTNKQQLLNLKFFGENIKAQVNKELINLNEMKTSSEPLLGLSLFEWNYRKSSLRRKIYLAISKISAILGPIFSWISIIGAASEGILAAFGIAVGLGASLTGVGLGLFAAGAFFCLGWNFGQNILSELFKLKAISDEKTSFLNRAGRISLIVVKCLGMALLKTLFIDYLFNLVKKLFVAEPIAEFIEAISFWPDENRVDDEVRALGLIQSLILEVVGLIDEQIDFIENKINPITKADPIDQSQELAIALLDLSKALDDCKILILGVSPNDARLVEKSYQRVMDEFERGFNEFKIEIGRLKNLQSVQTNLENHQTEVYKIAKNNELLVASMALQTPDHDKPIVVDMEAYKVNHQKQSGFFGNIYNWFKPKPRAAAVDRSLAADRIKTADNSQENLGSKKAELPLKNPLSISGENLVDSILEGISASTPELILDKPVENNQNSTVSSQPSRFGFAAGWFSRKNSAQPLRENKEPIAGPEIH